MNTHQTLLRLAAAAALSAVGAVALHLGGAYLLTLLPARAVETYTTAAVLVIGLAALAWYVLSGAVTCLCLLARTAGLAWAGGEMLVRRCGAPAIRKLLGSGAGAVLVAGSFLSPAYAQEPDEMHPPAPLTWSPSADTQPATDPHEDEDPQAPDEDSPEEQTPTTTAPGDAQHAPVEPTDPAPVPDGPVPSDPDPAPPPASYTVRSGDTLWSLAADALGEQATESQIAAEWPQWYRTNSQVIGADPDLIIPGQVLTPPERSTS